MNILDCLEYGAGSCRNEDLIDKLIARAEAAELELSQERFMRQAAEAENARLHVALEAIDAARAKATAEIEAVHQHLDECFVNDPDEGRAVPLIDRVVLLVSQIARDNGAVAQLREQVAALFSRASRSRTDGLLAPADCPSIGTSTRRITYFGPGRPVGG